jgi:hypothetical protein
MLHLTLVEKRASKSSAGALQASPKSVEWHVTPLDASQRRHFTIFSGGGLNWSILSTCGVLPEAGAFRRISNPIMFEGASSIVSGLQYGWVFLRIESAFGKVHPE